MKTCRLRKPLRNSRPYCLLGMRQCRESLILHRSHLCELAPVPRDKSDGSSEITIPEEKGGGQEERQGIPT
jgi:hypothetical protein